MLPLAPEQKTALANLNALMNAARVRSWLVDADYPAADLGAFRNYLKRSQSRRMEAILMPSGS